MNSFFLERISKSFQESIQVKQQVLAQKGFLELTAQVVELSVKSLKNGGGIYFCGNGGSAADAQHLSAELSGRFYIDRVALNSEALHCNTSFLTAIANDYSYEVIFSRAVESKCKKGDVLFALSTSGNSKNVVKAVEKAKELQVSTVGMTGMAGGKLKELCDFNFAIPSKDTPRIQECHITIGHIICELIEAAMFS